MFFELFGAYLEGGAVGSTNGCARVCYYKMQCTTQVIQKLGHHASNLCFVTLWVKGTLSMDSLNLGETCLLDKKGRNLVEWDTFTFACDGKKNVTRVPHRDFELQSPELWGNKNDLSAQLQIQSIGFEPNLSHFSSLESLHKKHVFRTFWGLSGGGRSRFYKRLCMRVLLQNAVRDTSHPETRTSRIEPVFCDIVGERNSEHGFVELGWNLTIRQKGQEPSRMGYVYIRMWWQKMWQEYRTEILNCNRQSYGATKTIWAHNFLFNWLVLKPNLSHFSFLESLHKKHVFRTFWGLSGGGRSRFYKRLCMRVLLQNAVRDTSHPETRTSRIEPVFCDIVGERNSEHGFFELRWNLTIGPKKAGV